MSALATKFEGIAADFWDCREDAEVLDHEYPDCAIEDYLDGVVCGHKACGAEAQIRELGPIQIWPWTRHRLQQHHIDAAVDACLERCEELLDEDEEIGDPNGEHDCLSGPLIEAHRGMFVEAVKALYAEATPWGSDQGKPITLTPDEVIELMRVHRPDWFEKETQSGGAR